MVFSVFLSHLYCLRPLGYCLKLVCLYHYQLVAGPTGSEVEDSSGTEEVLQIRRKDQPHHPGQDPQQGDPRSQGL